jgi:peroxiredoxin
MFPASGRFMWLTVYYPLLFVRVQIQHSRNPSRTPAVQEIHSEVRALGAEIVVVTPELERYTRALHKKLNLTFDILTDLHLKIAEQFRLVFTLPDYVRDLYKSFGSALDRFQDESEYRLPIPARYVVDKQGIIRTADVNADDTIRSEPSETLRQLRALTT